MDRIKNSLIVFSNSKTSGYFLVPAEGESILGSGMHPNDILAMDHIDPVVTHVIHSL